MKNVLLSEKVIIIIIIYFFFKLPINKFEKEKEIKVCTKLSADIQFLLFSLLLLLLLLLNPAAQAQVGYK